MQKVMVERMISIIIPVYNVKPYLEKCIYSVLNQTYHNIEILLVDDGSSDGSERICDEFALRDERIKVFHKKNGGASSARNLGLAHAKGEYIGFVDGDDYILDTMYEDLLGYMSSEIDITCCGTAIMYPKNSAEKKSTYCSLKYVTKMANHEAIREVLHIGNVSFSPCDKLFRRELFEQVYFPSGKTCEDLPVIYAILKKCRKIINIAQVKYIYCYRKDSASRKDFYLGRINYILFSRDILLDVKRNYPDLLEDAEAMYYRNTFAILMQMEATYNCEKFETIKQRMVLMLKHNYFKLLHNNFLTDEQKGAITKYILRNCGICKMQKREK